MKKSSKKSMVRIVAWMLVIAWMSVIFYLSSQPGAESDVTSGGIVDIIIRILKIDVTAMSAADAENTFTTINSIIRTIAHFGEYSILGVLVTFLSLTYIKKGRTVFIVSLGTSITYACSDEFHQSFVPHRSASVEDVAVDAVGALLGVVFVCILVNLINNHRKKKGNKALL